MAILLRELCACDEANESELELTLLFLFLALVPVNSIEHEATVLLVRLLAAFGYDQAEVICHEHAACHMQLLQLNPIVAHHCYGTQSCHSAITDIVHLHVWILQAGTQPIPPCHCQSRDQQGVQHSFL